MRFLSHLILLSVILFFPACLFGGKAPEGSVRGYKDGVVMLNTGSYHVGTLGPEWQHLALKQKTLAFRKNNTQTTIATNAFCGDNFDDAPLEVLARHLYMGVDAVVVLSQKESMVDGRRALSTVWSGRMDGVPVKIESLSVKKNDCLFDFYYVASPDVFDASRTDFTHFAEGFGTP